MLLQLALALVWSTAAPAAIKLAPLDADPGEQYKLTCTIEAEPEWPLDGVVRFGFDQGASGQGYALVLEPAKVYLVRLDGGREQLIAQCLEYPPLAESTMRMTVDRERWRMRLIVNGKVWLTAFDDTYPPGKIAYGSSTPKLKISDPQVQTTEEVWFADDFMREAGKPGEWQTVTGKWTLSGVSEQDASPQKRPDPSLSANPFAFRVERPKETAVATAGEWFWDTYRFETSLRAAGEGTVAVCVYYQDPDNYLAFRWHRGSGAGERELVAVRDGDEQILAIGQGAWAHDQWYRIGAEVVDNHLKASIDGQTVLEADTPLFGQGKIALLADGVTFADFDDVEVAGTDSMVDSFGQRTVGRWQVVEGEWEKDTDGRGPLDHGLRAVDSARGVAVTGSQSWRDYRAVVHCRAERGGGFGVLAGYQDPKNYMALRWGDAKAPGDYRNSLQLVRRRQGEDLILGQIPARFRRDLWHELSLESRSGFVRARIGEVPVFEWFDPELAGGKVGLLGESGRIEYDQLAVQFLPPPAKVEFTEVFAKDSYMTQWAQAAGSWEVEKAKERGGVFWHRGEFHGDTQLTVDGKLFTTLTKPLRLVLAGTRPGEQPPAAARAELASAEAPPPPAQGTGPGPEPVGAATATPAAADPDGGGYALVLTPSSGGKKVGAELQYGGQSRRRTAFELNDGDQLKFIKRGRFFLACLNDRCALAYQDPSPQPPAGIHVAAGLGGEKLDLERLDARCEQLFDTTFARAPWEWYTAKGIWETINRWKCDPRWSFFGGYDDLNPLIWSKDDYQGDIQVEAYMGIKMDLPGPPHYSHPSDLCLTIGGDGKDVLSGYSFLFAARNNTCSALYRRGREIAVNNKPEAKFAVTGWDNETKGDKFHRHWFHLVLRKARGRVFCSLDDKVLFDEPDDGSVPGGKVALYSVNNGIMVARVKIWYEALGESRPFADAAAMQATSDTTRSGDPLANGFEQGVGGFRPLEPRVPVLIRRDGAAAEGSRCLAITDLQSGGKFAVLATDQRFKPGELSKMSFSYRLPAEARVNVYLRARGTWHVVTLSGGKKPADGQRLLAEIPAVQADGKWHRAEVDLKGAFERLYGNAGLEVEQVVFGMMEPDPYLHAGFGANRFGTTYWLDDFRIGS